jgi:hypothetical protein
MEAIKQFDMTLFKKFILAHPNQEKTVKLLDTKK